MSFRPSEGRSYSQEFERATQFAQKGKFKKARAILKGLLRSQPNEPTVLEALGAVTLRMGAAKEAFQLLRQAQGVNPDSASLEYNIGLAALALDRFEDAARHLERSLELEPENLVVHQRLSELYHRLDQLDLAIAHLEACMSGGKPDSEAISRLVRMKRAACSWAGVERYEAMMLQAVSDANLAVRPFVLSYVSDDPQLQLQNAIAFARTYFADIPLRTPSQPKPTFRSPDGGKLRIGYMSANFRHHPTAYNLAGLVEAHDRNMFEIVGLSLSSDDNSRIRKRLAGAFDGFVDLAGCSIQESCKKVKDQEIDILVEMNGYTTASGVGLLLARPAPIQVHYRSFPGTLGCEFVDYLIVDKTVVPHNVAHEYQESLVYMPDCYWVTDSQPPDPIETCRSDHGLPDQQFVFSCLSTNRKITPTIFEIWVKILQAVEGSVLWLLKDNEYVAQNLQEESARRGLDPSRLIFAEKTDHADHIARLRLADLGLDTFPYGAHTTMTDALWADLPMLTCAGRSFPSRVAASMLGAVGLEELVTDSLAGYEAKAIELSQNPDTLADLRHRIAENRRTHAFFDTRTFCRNLESAYMDIWQSYLRGEDPASFSVLPARSTRESA